MNLKDSILKTIAFFDLFDFPLSVEEIQSHLYGYDKPVHVKEIKGSLDELAKEERLELIKDHYVLKGRTNILETRKARKFIAEKFWNRVNMYSRLMQSIPFIRMVAVCNNLAYDNVDEKSDIDLFIVVKPGHMWTARFLITLALHFFGVRRHGDKVAGRFCLSFFVTSDKLNMGELTIEPEDPYLAYWVQTLAPVSGADMYEQFKQVNVSWLKKNYNLSFLDFTKRHLSPAKESRWKQFSEWFFGNWFENLMKKTLKPKTLAAQARLGAQASVVVTDDMLKFHNNDRRREFYERWKKV